MLPPAQTGLVFQNETHAGVGALSDVGIAYVFFCKKTIIRVFFILTKLLVVKWS